MDNMPEASRRTVLATTAAIGAFGPAASAAPGAAAPTWSGEAEGDNAPPLRRMEEPELISAELRAVFRPLRQSL
jgi:hypothetical protein